MVITVMKMIRYALYIPHDMSATFRTYYIPRNNIRTHDHTVHNTPHFRTADAVRDTLMFDPQECSMVDSLSVYRPAGRIEHPSPWNQDTQGLPGYGDLSMLKMKRGDSDEFCHEVR